MCEKIVNVKKSIRDRSHLPNGEVVSLNELDTKFGDISSEERGMLSRKVLGALPKDELRQLNEWIETRTNARPVSLPFKELMTFFAVSHAALKVAEGSVTNLVETIVAQKSGAGIFLPKAA